MMESLAKVIGEQVRERLESQAQSILTVVGESMRNLPPTVQVDTQPIAAALSNQAAPVVNVEPPVVNVSVDLTPVVKLLEAILKALKPQPKRAFVITNDDGSKTTIRES